MGLKILLVLGFIIILGVTWYVFSSIDYEQEYETPSVKQGESIVIRQTDPHRGNIDAPIELLMVGSFTCPACRQSFTSVEQVQALYPEKIKVIWKDLPESKDIGYKAAIAARCAQHQGRFWEYSEDLFGFQDSILEEHDFNRIALDMGLNHDDFQNCLKSTLAGSLVDESISDGLQSGIDNIPHFQINNIVQLSGHQSFSQLRQEVELFIDSKI